MAKQFLVLASHTANARPFCEHHGLQTIERKLEVIVDDEVVELRIIRHFSDCLGHAP